MPIGTSFSPNFADFLAATRKSQSSAVMSPPAIACPFMAGDGRTRVLENPEVGRTIVSIPFANLVQIPATKNGKAVLKVDTGREHVALAGQDDWVWIEIALQPVERIVKVGKKTVVLSVDFVGVHDDHRAVVQEFDVPSHPVLLPSA